ncbi:MAG: FKBP-type peptidyl-prolyl cis-trans isomerase [Planctomycetota bacterium]
MKCRLACGLLLAAGSVPAQYFTRHESFDCRMTRVTWIGMSGEQRLAIVYDQPAWRPEYAAMAKATTQAQYSLGAGAWTTLLSSVDLAAGEVEIARGRWYLGLERHADATWTLTMTPADAVDASGAYVGAFLAKAEVRLPMRLEADEPMVERLAVTLAADKKQKREVTLALAWGTFRLSTKLTAAIDERVHPGTPEFAMSPKDKVVTTASGLQYEVLKAGTGSAPEVADEVIVSYAGWLTDGTLFDSSYHRGQPTRFPVHGVVKGFAEGLRLMQPGATYRLTIPPNLAYGDRAVGDIPANSTLVFFVELIGIGK